MREFFKDLWCDDWAGRAIAVLLASLVLCLVGVVSWAAYFVTETAFVQSKDGSAVLVGRSYHPAWTQLIIHSNGKGGSWTQIIYHPESWRCAFKINGFSDSLAVSRAFHDSSTIGKAYQVQYRVGRISGRPYVMAVASRN